MVENSGWRANRQVILLLLFISLCAFAIWWVLTPPGVDDNRSPRVVRLEQLEAQINPTENQHIALAPWLNADVFQVGAVFPLDGSFAIARSTACDQIARQATPMTLDLSDRTKFGFSPDLELVSQGKINAEATRTVEYSVLLSEVEIAPGEVELLNDLYSDPDCLAAIGNRDVLVLFGVYRGSEMFSITRAASGVLDFGFAFQNLKQKLGLSSEFADEDKFSRDGVAMYWALTKVRLNEPSLGGEGVPPEARLEIAKELVTNEADYAQRAIPNTDLAEPSQDEVDQVVEAILSSASD